MFRAKSRLSGLGRLRVLMGFVLLSQVSLPGEPTVRIGIERNVEGFMLSSTAPFVVEGISTRRAEFSIVIALGQGEGPFNKDDLETRIAVETDDESVFIRPMDAATVIPVRPGDAPLSVDGSTYRGDLEVRGTSGGSLTLVNELPLEDYLLGVVPNELGPNTFPELEALKAQSVAARTYIVRNLGQFEDEGFDICDTDFCQVYRGFDTEHPLATQAVEETRGQIATYEGEPINALYSSTCGGRTEDAENVFGESVPYLVSTICHYEHPDPQPFASTVVYTNWEEGLLGIAGVDDFASAGRFLGIANVGSASGTSPEDLASFIKSQFFPDVPADSDLLFLQEQGVLSATGENRIEDVLLRLLLRKSVFEWQDARLIRWDGEVFETRIGAEIRQLALAPDAALFRRVGDERIPVDQGVWMGGESMELRIVDDQIEALVYRRVTTSSAADRYSPLANWQTHRTWEELDQAIRALNIGNLDDIVILSRGPSNRAISVEVRGTGGQRVIEGSRLRTLLSLRDSLVYIDEERNANSELLGMSFFGGGWGHGVGLCQVGAYGMAIDGASAEDILKTYYRGIEIERAYQ
jgi:peptidoglycan hydrolase-like amidase